MAALYWRGGGKAEGWCRCNGQGWEGKRKHVVITTKSLTHFFGFPFFCGLLTVAACALLACVAPLATSDTFSSFTTCSGGGCCCSCCSGIGSGGCWCWAWMRSARNRRAPPSIRKKRDDACLYRPIPVLGVGSPADIPVLRALLPRHDRAKKTQGFPRRSNL